MRGGSPVDQLDTRNFIALALGGGFGSIQFWMTVPLAALALAGQGVPAWTIGLIGATPWIILVLLIPQVPWIAARFGAIRIFRAGCWLGLAGAVAFAAGNSLALWALGYALCGAGIALRWIVSDALIAALSPPAVRGRRVGLYEMWIGATMALGPLILAIASPSGPLPFLLGVLFAAAAIPAALLARIPDASTAATGMSGGLRALVAALRGSPTTLVAATACGVIEGASTKLFPVQAYQLGFEETIAAITVAVFGAGNLLTQYPIGRLAERHPSRQLFAAALTTIIAAGLALPAAAATAPVFLALLAAIGGMSGALYTLSVIRAGHAGSATAAIRIVAGVGLAYTLGSTLGPIIAGFAVSTDPVWGLPLAIATTATVALVVIRRMPG